MALFDLGTSNRVVIYDYTSGDFGMSMLGSNFDESKLSGKLNPEGLSALEAIYQESLVTVSPLILDLDGDGVESLGIDAGVQFDHDANGTAERSGCAGVDDGLLVRDLNGNGSIDSWRELFGNSTKLASGGFAANGFAALADLDSNHDGWISAADTAFSQLRVWKDINSNAVVDAGEHTISLRPEYCHQRNSVGYLGHRGISAGG